ncbi:hypothetical protein HNY73_002276 [Argiope bruennichi]|uniref:Uncharacterized protein n=1 Tax=Argiope bruennichi TaxID=94029 RepID=A0A8T0FXA7_ARGBR|nr:hypothetical protein HNY73_002276 [Argiope bruennichi]
MYQNELKYAATSLLSPALNLILQVGQKGSWCPRVISAHRGRHIISVIFEERQLTSAVQIFRPIPALLFSLQTLAVALIFKLMTLFTLRLFRMQALESTSLRRMRNGQSFDTSIARRAL